MKRDNKLSRTVAALLSASAVHAAIAADTAGSVASGMQLQEVIVTAQRQAQNIQDVPITMQAFTGKSLQDMNVKTFGDLVKYLPNVSTGTIGPGQGQVFMRGLSVGVVFTQGQGSVGGFPNVAEYLDNQSTTLPGRNLDIYAVDLQRVEVLEGPQGTLFGAGAQAGVVRFITNKPKLDTFQVNVHAGYGITAHGGPNTNADAVFNLPLIKHKLAARIVVFSADRGGYINNLPATFARAPTDLGIAASNGGIVPTNSTIINNYQIAANHINPVTYRGIRGEFLYKFDRDWNVLLSQMYQTMDAQGVFYEMPLGSNGQSLPPYSVNLFNPSYNKDKFENTELDVHGKIGDLNLIYTGAYLDRNVDQKQDYTNYARGRYGYYYQCTGVSYSSAQGNPNATCYSPSAVWTDTERNTHLSQEVRISTPDDWRLRGLVGFFYEDYKIYDTTQWLYKSVPDCSPGGPTSNCFLPIQPWPGAPANQPGVHSASVGFFDDFVHTFTQKAVYASVSYDIIPHKLTITGGIRYFDMFNKELGGDVGSFGCKQFAPTSYFGPCLSPNGTNFSNPKQQSQNQFVETGKRGRVDLEWHILPQAMVYYTYSQGFRPGGFNRGSSEQLPNQNGVYQFSTPLTYQSDNLTNNEIGWKTLWWQNRLEVDGSAYQENWSNVQVAFLCPQCGLGNLAFGTNGPDYRVRGIELQILARPMEGLTINASASWNSGELVNSPALVDNNPATPNFGQPITTWYNHGVAEPLANLYGKIGSPLANSPPFQMSALVRYDWSVGNYIPYVQFGVQHRAHAYSASGNVEAYILPAWTTYDFAAGVSRGRWTVTLSGTNITNVNKSLLTSNSQSVLTETPMRPRVIELGFNYQFSEHDN